MNWCYTDDGTLDTVVLVFDDDGRRATHRFDTHSLLSEDSESWKYPADWHRSRDAAVEGHLAAMDEDDLYGGAKEC